MASTSLERLLEDMSAGMVSSSTDCQKQILSTLLRGREVSDAADGKANPNNFIARQNERRGIGRAGPEML